MALRKTLKFLPTVFQTDTNSKFLSATLDQFVSEPELKPIHGYIGRKFAPTYKTKDSYILEDSVARQNYQLEPSIVARDEQQNITFFASYVDLLNKIEYYGGITDNHSRLFASEYYSFDPQLSFDKFINFTQYFWLPDGPDPIAVHTGGVPLTANIIVHRDSTTNKYSFEYSGRNNSTLILARGGLYTFEVNQPGHPFWIQIEPGIDGTVNATPGISSREVLGVTNNGIDVGTITFLVPQSDAQDNFASMEMIYNVDYALPLAYSEIQHQKLTDFIQAFPAYDPISVNINEKTVIFVDQNLLTNYGEAAWQTTALLNEDDEEVDMFNATYVVTEAQRYGVWKIMLIDIAGETYIRLVPVIAIPLNNKVYIQSGIKDVNREYFKDYDAFLHRVPVNSSIQNTMYYQDSSSTKLYGQFNVVSPVEWQIDVEQDIVGKIEYTSPNGIQFSSGLKVAFGNDVTPATYRNKEYYVEGVGIDIRLIDTALLVTPELYIEELATNYPGQVFPDYITINRANKDLNAWTRSNRWFHRSVIEKTAEYNATTPTYDQLARAQRPIIQFNNDCQLFNHGRIGKQSVDILDMLTRDAFTEVEGTYQTVFRGVQITNGTRIIFANDNDPLVRNKIYEINLVYLTVDELQQPVGDPQITLTLAADSATERYDSIVVNGGGFKGTAWWFDGTQWVASQAKTNVQQDPLFDMFDATGNSLSTYPASTFAGTKVFGYKRNTAGRIDPVLQFPLSYRNFGTQGDIEFSNYYNLDTFSYTANSNVRVSTGVMHRIVDRYTSLPATVWTTVVEDSKQYQLISYTYAGPSTVFVLDVTPAAEASIPYLKVFQNNVLLTPAQWTFDTDAKIVSLVATPTLNDKIDILVYSTEVSKLGHYQIPVNLDLNAQNIELESMTLGQIRNHVVALSHNCKEVEGDILGPNNLRDVELTAQGGNILQHSAPVSHAALFLLNEDTNFVNAVRYAQQEYARFKNKFLEYSTTLNGIEPTNPAASVDLILTTINSIKTQLFPWHYSDMVPYGSLKNVINDPGYTVFNPLVRTYEISNVFNSNVLSNRATLVYLNGTQLILGKDYTFNTDRPAVTFNDTVLLEVDDLITIVEYENTDGCYIPETPTKLGLYPKFMPEIFLDDTYRTAINVIRGHDGSIMPAFNDYRDDFVLELEKRIYNNIKVPHSGSYAELHEMMPGKFREHVYTWTEANQVLSGSFLNWVGNNKLNYSTNDTFNANDPFTWNYSKFVDRIDGEQLPGGWKACFQYFYDTIRPHQTPWEMLGFAIKPDWWEDEYGVAPYTGGNTLLWDDLEAGLIKQGPRAGIDNKFARPGLSAIIPVDDNGNLKSPAAILTASFASKYAALNWTIGDQGPAEVAWRNSSDFPFAIQLALALAKPGKYFGVYIDVNSYLYNNDIGQFLTSANGHIKQTSTSFNGDISSGTVFRSAGYLNWVADYLTNLGINPSSKITPLLKNYKVNLAYKLAGFSDHKYLQVLAEQSSPTSTNDSIIIPNDNYEVYLYKSTPVDKLTYSAVIVEKTNVGFSVRGYDLSNPHFTIIPSVINSNASKISVLAQTAAVYNDYQPIKLTVPYGHDFNNMQQVVDFLISYERYLLAQGFTFNDNDGQLNELRNWKLSAKEFLFWAQQGWPNGSILVLSPTANVLSSLSSGAITDGISDSQYGTKILDQNFKLVKNNNYNVLRTPSSLKVELTNGQVIGLMTLDLVQYEHVLVFDNTTVFNDIIYKPELGNRQYRLKLIGQKTASWDGSLTSPGFIYNSTKVDPWLQGKDYLKGVLVQYKDQYYVALQNVIASELFDFSMWKTVDADQIKTGLLPNFASNSVKSQSYYDAYGYFNDADNVKYSHGLIGFKPRQYLDEMGLNETTQVEFYKGYITQKGTANAIDALTNAQFNNLNSAISYYEEWAVRVGEYGAIDINPYVEITLDEKAFSVTPALAEFVAPADASRADGITVFAATDLYKSTNQFDGTIASERNTESDYSNDIPTAGYVNIDDIDVTIFDLANYTDLNSLTYSMGSSYTIWTAKDFKSDWNIFRVTETDTTIVEVENALDGFITFRTDVYHGLTEDTAVMIRNFDAAFDGFYEVYKVVNLSSFMVRYIGDTSTLINLTGSGVLFTLDSLRFDYMETARNYVPPHGWKVGEKIWIDEDAATSIAQGQPVDTKSGGWKVYEKTHPWELNQRLVKDLGEYSANIGYGQAVKMIDNAEQTIFVGAPLHGGTGAVNVFNRNASNVYVAGETIIPDGADTFAFGSHIDTAVDGTKVRLAVNAPTSLGVASAVNVGLLYIYNKLEGETTWNRAQVIRGYDTAFVGGQFGHGFAFDELGHWLYVGAPYEIIPKVYVYGLQRFITEASGTVTTVGSVATITVPFTPEVTDDANSLLVTSATRTYIPEIDYTLSGTTITFISGNVNGTFTISQAPYYTLLEVIEGPADSEFGFCVDSSLNGAQLGVGAPGASVLGTDDVLMEQAGAVYVYDRVIEAFNSTNDTVYTTEEIIADVHKVTVDDVEALDYTVTGTNEITLFVPLGVGKIVKIETNKFTLLETLIGIDSLDGSLSAIQQGARFGTSLTICSNNCAFYIGAPYYNADTIYNTGAVWKFHNRGTLYGTNTGYTQNPTFNPGDTIRLDNFQITVTGSTLDSLVDDINGANLLGITAVNENGYLRLNSDKTVAKNRLRILSASGTVYANAGMAIFAFMQIIVNPYQSSNEYFGTKVILARNAYMLLISSERGTTRKYTTFDDNTTIFDQETTGIFDSVRASGSVYTYELYDDPRDQVENPGRYAFCQQIDPTDLNPGDSFGAAIDIIGGYILVSAPNDDTTIENGGSIYLFDNPTGKRGWSLIRYQQPLVDLDSVNRLYVYNKQSNIILTNLEFIDPAAGKILGRAEQELSYKTSYDPAIYNRGGNNDSNSNTYWGAAQVGRVWWNLDQVRYIDYEQGSLAYRSINWGRLFPGSSVEVLEWVESNVLPSEYVVAGNNGSPKHADNSAYVEIMFVDPLSNIISTKYYYWVKDKTSLDTNNPTRTLPVKVIKDLIENPKNNGVAYSAIVSPSAVILYNISEHLTATDTILHIDYDLIRNSSIIHSEYELLQKGNSANRIPDRIINKLIDSLVGQDEIGSAVPDMSLSIADRYGISIRPRQSMFVDRIAAVNVLIEYVNNLFITTQYTTYNLTHFLAEEAYPSKKLNEYDQQVTLEEELSYIDLTNLQAGYKVLVETNPSYEGRWTLHQLTSAKVWEIIRIQSYKTSLYWDYIDWYAAGYDATTKPTYSVTTLVDALKLPFAPDNIIKITNTGEGLWELIRVDDALEFVTVGKQNGTLQLNESKLTDATLTQYTELRNIVVGLRDDIFVDSLAGEFNKLFFELMNHLFAEQTYVDWIFKTSFISVVHKLRGLTQPPNYIKDNQTYYQDYINEVKPYSTKIREYLLNYTSVDEVTGNIIDFDLPPYYDHSIGVFRSPSGEQIAADSVMWQTEPYKQWYDNRTYEIESIIIGSSGSGYASAPIVEIYGNGTGATAHAIINFDTGEVTDVIVDNPGTGYTQQVVIILNGNGTGATAYARLHNHKIRSFNTKLKFDRISYSSAVKEWTANTAFTAGDIVSYDAVGYLVNANITTSTNFVASDYTLHPSADFTNANDRIMANYAPGNDLPAKNLAHLLYGIDYPGVKVQGLTFDQAPGLDSGTFDLNLFDQIQYDIDGLPMTSDDAVNTLIQSSYGDVALGTRPEDIDVVGGAYVDTYSSHAPEELVPGIVFDTLNMQVYTKILANTVVLGYRILHDMAHNPTYLRISGIHQSVLAAPLNIADSLIYVEDASQLPVPDPEGGVPGVVFIRAERITYYTIDLDNNTLGQLRRGTAGTAPCLNYQAGLAVVDASHVQQMPEIISGNVSHDTDYAYTVTTTPPYELTFTDAILLSRGDNITQDGTGANVTVTAMSTLTAETIQVSAFLPVLQVGDIVTQSSSGTVATVVKSDTNTNYITLVYSTGQFTTGSGNISLSSIDTGAYPTSASVRTVTRASVIKNNNTPFDFASANVGVSGNITVSSGSYITQSSTGANAIVQQSVTDSVYVNLAYIDATVFDLSAGNIAINGGAETAIRPITSVYIANVANQISINGTISSDVAPVAMNLLADSNSTNPSVTGPVDSNGNVTVIANVTLKTDNAWYNPDGGFPSDGLGFQATSTVQVLFLKDYPSGYPESFVMGTEDSINITTESEIEIIGEFGDIDNN